jgi:Tfp pilus assembly protein PilX/cytoskeletal protein CcmA (bactofilin family)
MLKNRSKRRGFSLMMVTAVVAVASVMGIAILSSSALQADASSNQDQATRADGLAESGIAVGLYYLQNLNDSTKCPMPVLTNPGGVYTKLGQSLGTGVSGTYDLTITRLSSNRYTITSTGNATSARGAVQRSLTATVEVNYFPYALTATNASTLLSSTLPAVTANGGTTILGDVYSNGPLTVNATVSGSIYGGNGLLGGLIKTITGVVVTLVPTTANVNHYASYYYNNKKYIPPTISVATDIPAQPADSNPAGVYICSGNLDVAGNVKINGTIVLTSSGSLRVSGTGNQITPVAGFPALVADGDITFRASNSTVDLLGLTYMGGKVTRSSSYTGCKLNVTGGLLYGGTSTISLDSNIAVLIKYDRTKASVPDLVSGGNPQPASVTVTAWQN